jgi:hypothetical protein
MELVQADWQANRRHPVVAHGSRCRPAGRLPVASRASSVIVQ